MTAPTTVPGLARNEITHRVLALCAEADAISVCHHPDGLDMRLSLRGDVLHGNAETSMCFVLTALHSGGLIAWRDDRNLGVQYAEGTS